MKKVTKRERKALRGHNAAMMRSIRDGWHMPMSDREYHGQNKEFIFGQNGHLIRTVPGIPFVRVVA